MSGLYVIPSDLPSVFEALTNLNQAQQLAIIRPNNPPPGIAGWLAEIPGDEEVRLRSQITRHYTEENVPVQDMIALEPEEIKLRGIVAELSTGLPATPPTAAVNQVLPLLFGVIPTPSLGQLARVVGIVAASAGSTLASVAGGLAVSALASLNAALSVAQAAAIASTSAAQAAQIFSAANSAPEGLYAYEQNLAPQQPNQTKQSNAFAYLYQLWLGRVLFSVETPFGVMNNMAILDLRMVQEAGSRQRSNFEVTFQKIRIVGDTTTQSGRLAARRLLQESGVPSPTQAGLPPVTTAQATSLYQSFA